MNTQKMAEAVERRLEQFEQDGVGRRIWAKDHTVWRPEPREITDRLGWLTVHEALRRQIPDLTSFAEHCASDGLRTAVLAGMGGSSLAPEVFRETFAVADGALELIVLDTTHPDQIRTVEERIDLNQTLFVIASKSGGTTETLSHFAYFWDKIPDGSHFVCITDPGTSLQKLAEEHEFRRVFQNQPDIGGRYSALSHFGLVNAALVGVDLESLLAGAHDMSEACGPDVPAAKNPGMALGAAMGEAAFEGRDKLTLVLPPAMYALGYWIEQLIAESTGKEGRGILPVEGEDLGPPRVYGEDRLFVATGAADGEALDALVEAGNPEVRISFEDVMGLAGEMFRWEFATAVAGAVIGIQPFDQPNVQSAKDATKRILSEGEIPQVDPGDLEDLLASSGPGRYLSIHAYIPRDEGNISRLHTIRMRLRDRLQIATTVGFGPRFLHSTGQLHKGGPNTGLFVQVVDEPQSDLPIPGQPYSFGHLIAAQAAGDLMALRERDRQVARVSLSELEAV
jgi:transaldolase / glucose-6-phosphate isomerase